MAMVDFKEEELTLLRELVEKHVDHTMTAITTEHNGWSVTRMVCKDDLLTKLKYGITVAKGVLWR